MESTSDIQEHVCPVGIKKTKAFEVLMNPVFEPYARWTGNQLEFEIIDANVFFTEFRKRKDDGVEPTMSGDPKERWRDILITDENKKRIFIKNNLRSLSQHYPKYHIESSSSDKPIIQKTELKGRYKFVSYQCVCTRLFLTEDALLRYARDVGQKYASDTHISIRETREQKSLPSTKKTDISAQSKCIDPIKSSDITCGTSTYMQNPPLIIKSTLPFSDGVSTKVVANTDEKDMYRISETQQDVQQLEPGKQGIRPLIGGYQFNGHEYICDYLHMPRDTLLQYAAKVGEKYPPIPLKSRPGKRMLQHSPSPTKSTSSAQLENIDHIRSSDVTLSPPLYDSHPRLINVTPQLLCTTYLKKKLHALRCAQEIYQRGNKPTTQTYMRRPSPIQPTSSTSLETMNQFSSLPMRELCNPQDSGNDIEAQSFNSNQLLTVPSTSFLLGDSVTVQPITQTLEECHSIIQERLSGNYLSYLNWKTILRRLKTNHTLVLTAIEFIQRKRTDLQTVFGAEITNKEKYEKLENELNVQKMELSKLKDTGAEYGQMIKMELKKSQEWLHDRERGLENCVWSDDEDMIRLSLNYISAEIRQFQVHKRFENHQAFIEQLSCQSSLSQSLVLTLLSTILNRLVDIPNSKAPKPNLSFQSIIDECEYITSTITTFLKSDESDNPITQQVIKSEPDQPSSSTYEIFRPIDANNLSNLPNRDDVLNDLIDYMVKHLANKY